MAGPPNNANANNADAGGMHVERQQNNDVHEFIDVFNQWRMLVIAEQQRQQATLNEACRRGNLEHVVGIIDVDNAIVNIQEAFEVACDNLHANVIEYLITKQVNAYGVLMRASYGGNLDLIKILAPIMMRLPRGLNLNMIIRYAAIMGREHVVEYYVSLGANDFNDAFYHAAFYGQIGILRMFAALCGRDANVAPITQDTIIRTIKQVSATFHTQTLALLLSMLSQPLSKDSYDECVKKCQDNTHLGKNQGICDVLIKYGQHVNYMV